MTWQMSSLTLSNSRHRMRRRQTGIKLFNQNRYLIIARFLSQIRRHVLEPISFILHLTSSEQTLCILKDLNKREQKQEAFNTQFSHHKDNFDGLNPLIRSQAPPTFTFLAKCSARLNAMEAGYQNILVLISQRQQDDKGSSDDAYISTFDNRIGQVPDHT